MFKIMVSSAMRRASISSAILRRSASVMGINHSLVMIFDLFNNSWQCTHLSCVAKTEAWKGLDNLAQCSKLTLQEFLVGDVQIKRGAQQLHEHLSTGHFFYGYLVRACLAFFVKHIQAPDFCWRGPKRNEMGITNSSFQSIRGHLFGRSGSIKHRLEAFR